jgi:small nuclear ribonucleoprotein (snRNP)-like protein
LITGVSGTSCFLLKVRSVSVLFQGVSDCLLNLFRLFPARPPPLVGILACLDGYMNIAMEQTEVLLARIPPPSAPRRILVYWYRLTPTHSPRVLTAQEYVNGQLKNKYGDAFIRGNNGGLPPLPLSLSSMPDFHSPVSLRICPHSLPTAARPCSFVHKYCESAAVRVWGSLVGGGEEGARWRACGPAASPLHPPTTQRPLCPGHTFLYNIYITRRCELSSSPLL